MSSHEDIPLRAVKYGVAVSWDLGRQAVDLDLQARLTAKNLTG